MMGLEDENGDDSWWVIPHQSSLDYCHVTITDVSRDPLMVKVTGRQTEGWTRSGATIKTQVPLDKLTKTPSWHTDFLTLYEDPCHPINRPRCETRTERLRRLRQERLDADSQSG